MQLNPSVLDDVSGRPPRQPDDPNSDVIPSLSTKHPIFVLVTAIGFGFLYAELVFFAMAFYGEYSEVSSYWAACGGVFALLAVATALSFYLPHRIYRRRFARYSPIIFLMREWTISVVILALATLATFVLGIFLVKGELGAVGELLRSSALYLVVVSGLFHGLAIFVRYVQYLYERELHQSYKIVTIVAGAAVVIVLITLYLLPFDLGRIGTNTPHNDLLSLHLSIRDVSLLFLSLFCYFWHISVIADH